MESGDGMEAFEKWPLDAPISSNRIIRPGRVKARQKAPLVQRNRECIKPKPVGGGGWGGFSLVDDIRGCSKA